jgi:pimeloyl-ACP methyl ester carboxylesterase
MWTGGPGATSAAMDPAARHRRNLDGVSTFTHHGFTIAFEERTGGSDSAQHPLVLLHGLLFPRKHQYSLADALAERGNRVILVDLLGHGESDRPADPRHYRMEHFADEVVGLLDHLQIATAVIGGTSLGANVALEVAVRAPGRVRALFLEMPVLEKAAVTAGAIFVPLTFTYRRFERPAQAVARLSSRIPRSGRQAGVGLYADVMLDFLSQDPASSEAIVHGLLSGEIAPHPTEREKIDLPALIVGHEHDLLHPFSDAEELHRELLNSELVQAGSFFELRFPPNRLSARIGDFLDGVWS